MLGEIKVFDESWQDPGETEYEAWRELQSMTMPDDVLYLAVPWTWMIDAMQAGRTAELQQRLAAFAATLPTAETVLTVCTHADLALHWPMLRSCGVTEVFWPNLAAPPAELAQEAVLHPMALFAAPPAAEAGFVNCIGSDPARRIWDALSKGGVPVFRLDALALPGNAQLWLHGAVPCDQSTDLGEPLRKYLEALAADPVRMAEKRHLLHQLSLEHCGTGLVQPVHRRLLAIASLNAGREAAGPSIALLTTLLETLQPKLAQGTTLSSDEASLVMVALSAAVLLGGGPVIAQIGRGRLGRLQMAAEAVLPHESIERRHLGEAIEAMRTHPAPAMTPTSPALTGKAALRVNLFGYHANRTPLSYAPLRATLGDRVIFSTAEDADLVVAGFNLDFRRNFDQVLELATRRTSLKFTVLSEEPLWDTTWSGGFTEPRQTFELAKADGQIGQLDFSVLNHFTSDIFNFARIPYFLLTDDALISRLRAAMARFHETSPAEMLARWQQAPLQAAFIAERRDSAEFHGAWPEAGIFRVSGYRSALAAQCEGSVLRMGKGWDTRPARQKLADWHLDKLAHVDGKVRLLSALENTHFANYVTEKPFDAFATGAVPICLAMPDHRLFELVPATAMLNTCGLEPPVAAAAVAAFAPTIETAESWLETCGRLVDLLGDVPLIQAERAACMDRVITALRSLV